MASRPFGSIVGLRREYEAWYRVLHRHVFPGVLDRIARSNIRNYSIYLHDGILFSHLEYVGNDHDADMAAIAGDETTREWWTLTDPMQYPLDGREPGEWWTKLAAIYSSEGAPVQPRAVAVRTTPGAVVPVGAASLLTTAITRTTVTTTGVATLAAPTTARRRHAFVAPLPDRPPEATESALAAIVGGDVPVLRVFRSRERFYIYLESFLDSIDHVAVTIAEALALGAPPIEIEEVFHTDGVGQHAAGSWQLAADSGTLSFDRAAAAPASAPDRSPVATRTVFVSGCFDLLHSGHVAFLEQAATYGEVHVGIGSDATIYGLKGRYTVNSEDERKYMIEALRCVKECRVNRGSGFLDFEEDLRDLRPDLLLVNEDGHSPAKEALCRALGIEYVVLKRIPHAGLPPRATTTLRTESRIPFRIDLAGGWLDQPWVSCHYPGPVLTISIEPTMEFNDRSGMASSTRRKAIDLWHAAIPHGDPEQLAKLLFSYENPPGTEEVAGSQDALGIVLPGLNRLFYEGHYWPSRIESVHDEEVLCWLESRLHLVTLGPRVSSFRVLDDVRVDRAAAKALSDAAEDCWRAALARDTGAFGDAFARSFEAQVAMFPLMVDAGIRQVIEQCRDGALGWKLSGAGGGGYLILVADEPVPNTVPVKIRRRGAD